MIKDAVYMTLKQAAEEFDLSYTTLRRDAERRLLPAFRTGRKYFVERQAVQAYAQRCANGGHAAEGYTIKQIMEVLPLSYAFLIELIHSGKLRAYKCGRRYIIPQDALEEFLAASRLDKAYEHTEQLLQEEQGEESEQ